MQARYRDQPLNKLKTNSSGGRPTLSLPPAKNNKLWKKIGTVIERKVREQGRNISWLARQLSCHRTNIYDIFRRSNIDIVMLQRLSEVLNYDFFMYLSKEMHKKAAESKKEEEEFN